MSVRKPSKPPYRQRQVDDHPRHQSKASAQKKHIERKGSETTLQSKPRMDVPGSYWLFGYHAVTEALKNSRRRIHRVLVSDESNTLLNNGIQAELTERHTIDQLVGNNVVHQGICACVSPLPETDIYEICDLARDRSEAVVVVLDQVTDPHNVGAILRSAAAFGALAVILTERHAAPESGILAKSASGALEHVPLVRVSNLARSLEELKEAGFWCIGLASEAKQNLSAVKSGGKVALCLGGEGTGLRRLTRDRCDLLVRLPTAGPIDHLNVSNAAAISLYEISR